MSGSTLTDPWLQWAQSGDGAPPMDTGAPALPASTVTNATQANPAFAATPQGQALAILGQNLNYGTGAASPRTTGQAPTPLTTAPQSGATAPHPDMQLVADAAQPANRPAGPMNPLMGAPPAPVAPPQPTPGTGAGPAMPPPVAPPQAPQAPPMQTAIANPNPTAAKLALMDQPYQQGAGYYGLVHAGEGSGVNPITGATGDVQVMPKTLADFQATPQGKGVDVNTPDGAAKFTQWYGDQNATTLASATGQPATNGAVIAAHLLGPDGATALLTHPNDPIKSFLSPGAIKNNPGPLPDPNMTGSQAFASIKQYYAGAGGGTTTAQGAPSGSSQFTGAVAAQPTQGGGASTSPTDDPLAYANALKANLPFPNLGKQFGNSNGLGLMMLASGILGGKNLAQGIGEGLKGMTAVANSDEERKFQANQMQMQLNQLGIQHQYQSALLGLRSGTLANQTATTAYNTGANNPTGTGSRLGDQTTLANNRATNTQNNNQVGQYTKDNLKESDEMVDAGTNATSQLNTINQYQTAIQNGGLGPTLVDKFKRDLATQLGINIGDVTQDGVLSAKLMQQRMGLMGVAGMKGTGLRTEKEFNQFTGQFGSLDQNPENLAPILATLKSSANRDLAMQNDWTSMDPDQKTSIMKQADGVRTWQKPYIQNWQADLGVTAPTLATQRNGSSPTTQAAPPAGGGGGGLVKVSGPPTAKNPSGVYMVPPDKVALYNANGYK